MSVVVVCWCCYVCWWLFGMCFVVSWLSLCRLFFSVGVSVVCRWLRKVWIFVLRQWCVVQIVQMFIVCSWYLGSMWIRCFLWILLSIVYSVMYVILCLVCIVMYSVFGMLIWNGVGCSLQMVFLLLLCFRCYLLVGDVGVLRCRYMWFGSLLGVCGVLCCVRYLCDVMSMLQFVLQVCVIQFELGSCDVVMIDMLYFFLIRFGICCVSVSLIDMLGLFFWQWMIDDMI